MSKILNWLFSKKKERNKNVPIQHYKNEDHIYVVRNGHDPRGIYEKSANPSQRRTSETLSRDPVHLDRQLGTANRKIKSYPTSPERRLIGGSGYSTDQQVKYVTNKTANPYKRNSQVIYIAGVPSTLSNFQQTERASNEPFPFEIPPDPVPRRSTLFYDMQYNVQDPRQSCLYAAEKPIEDEQANSTEQRSSREKRVTITTPEEEVTKEQENVDRKTVIRFRPQSSGNYDIQKSVKFMTLRASDVNPPPQFGGKYVHRLPLKPSKHTPPIATIDGKLLKPVVADKVRRPSVISEKEIQSIRISVTEPLSDDGPVIRRSFIPETSHRQSMGHATTALKGKCPEPEKKTEEGFPFKQQDNPVVYAIPSIPNRPRSKSILRHSTVNRRSTGRRLSSTNRQSIAASLEQFHYQQEDEPVVYAVVPTRGRSRSVLQQSVKKLTSGPTYNEPQVHCKNIRYSMDTDVFSADPRRRSISPPMPGYINMEKGQSMLVSDALNPITSLFISDLKDPIPKDPLMKPQEANVWVKPKRYSVQRQSPNRSSRVLLQEPRSPTMSVKRRQSKQYYASSRGYSSSSDENIQVYKKKSKPSQQSYQHQVYAAQMPDIMFPVDKAEKSFFTEGTKESRPSTSKDFCGLNCEVPLHAPVNNQCLLNCNKYSDDEDDLDLVCYPSDRALKNLSQDDNDTNSKLRWRIIIKRGDEK